MASPGPDGERRTSKPLLAPVAVGMAAALAAALAWWQFYSGSGERAEKEEVTEDLLEEERPALLQVSAEGSRELLEVLRGYADDDVWPPVDRVAPVTVERFPDDLDTLHVDERKEAFLRVLTPIVLAENQRIQAKRQFIQEAAHAFPELDDGQRHRLEALAERYRVDAPVGEGDFFRRLLRRVDEVPPALALAQAANESGWGTSRFTREANNLFGEWTWIEGEGLVPEERPDGERYAVRIFPSLARSVRSYYYNLNVGHAYHEFRMERQVMRRSGKPLDPVLLAGTLTAYSERGADYVSELRAIMRVNDMVKVSNVVLAER